MVSTDILSRTFHIRYGESTGTCFTVDINNKQYFVTAKHVVEDINDGDTISIFQNGSWKNGKVELTGHSENSDVTVFSLKTFIQGNYMQNKSDGLIFGQDLYFLGFPYGLKSEVGELNRDFPLPLIKKATLSAIIPEAGNCLLLDGLNNPGFSGGPVIFKENNTNNYSICGIISGYRFELVETIIDGQPTPIQAKTNTGIIIAYGIENALQLIKANPNGRQL